MSEVLNFESQLTIQTYARVSRSFLRLWSYDRMAL